MSGIEGARCDYLLTLYLHIYPCYAIYIAVIILSLWASVLPVNLDSAASNEEGGKCHQLTMIV